jgi:hypothetical protein
MNHSSVKHETVMVNNITNHNNTNHSSVKHETDTGMVHIIVIGDIVDHYCFMFDTAVVHIVVAGDVVDHYCFMFDTAVVHITTAVSNMKQ